MSWEDDDDRDSLEGAFVRFCPANALFLVRFAVRFCSNAAPRQIGANPPVETLANPSVRFVVFLFVFPLTDEFRCTARV